MSANITDPMRALAVLSLEQRLLPPRQAVEFIQQVRSNNADLAALLLAQLGEIPLLRAIAAELKTPFHDLNTGTELRVDPAILKRCDLEMLRRYHALPMLDRDDKVVVGVRAPNLEVRDYMELRFPEGFKLVLMPPSQIDAELTRAGHAAFEDRLAADLPSAAPAQAAAKAAPPVAPKSVLVDWVDSVLTSAAADKVSDIHFNLDPDGILVLRFRQDGVMVKQPVPAALRTPARTREVLGTILNKSESFDPTNTMEPQDGTFSFEVNGRQIDVRVAMLPQIHGPMVVLRLLDSASINVRITDVGFSETNVEKMRRHLQASQGTILCVGPTGSGKTTTLYGLLKELDPVAKNIITVENPVEYQLRGVNQTPIREDLGERSVTFPRALRSILRCDPDVILVGEIRDSETARVAMEAAITGHLVLSSLHTNSALGAYPRLSQMGVPEYMVIEALSLVISQRLLRKLHDCAVWDVPNEEEMIALSRAGEMDFERVRHARGCGGCKGSGYKGRVAVAEVLEPNHALRGALARQLPQQELERVARAEGLITISGDALRHVREGNTTVAEASRTFDIVQEES